MMSGCYCSPVSATVCEAPIFASGASGVAVEPFSSTIVNSEILYQCQTGFLQEGGHCCVEKMGGGTLTLRVSVQVKEPHYN